MLIRKEKTYNGGLLGIWKMDESTEELLNLFPKHLRSEANAYVRSVRSERRSIEWLATRIMLLVLLGEEKIIHNQEDGKPYLADGTHQISISHTKNYAAILLHESSPVGIDIETRSERVERIANKFISEDEYIDPSQRILHQLLHWSTKECLFKLMNEQGIDFKRQLHIQPFTPAQRGIIKATETKTLQSRTFNVCYEVHTDYVLTWVVEEQRCKKNAPKDSEAF